MTTTTLVGHPGESPHTCLRCGGRLSTEARQDDDTGGVSQVLACGECGWCEPDRVWVTPRQVRVDAAQAVARMRQLRADGVDVAKVLEHGGHSAALRLYRWRNAQ